MKGLIALVVLGTFLTLAAGQALATEPGHEGLKLDEQGFGLYVPAADETATKAVERWIDESMDVIRPEVQARD